MEKNLRQLKLFLDFYFAPWGAAKGEVWEDCFSYPFDAESANKIASDILSGTPGLSPDEEKYLRIIVGD
jgi:hypothetical protein